MNAPASAGRRVLIAWEIGDNFGHVLPLLAIARHLRDAGCGVVFALRDLRRAGPVRAEGFAVLQAPAHADRWFRPGTPQPANLAEVLAIFGFTGANVLDIYVAAWRHLYTLARPDLVMVSHAPTAILAARLAGIPAAIMALPFELPPPGVPLPSLRPWENIPAARHAKAEAAVVNTINRIARKRLHISALHELFDVERVYLNTFAELDTWGTRGTGHYGGALFDPDTGSEAVWPEGEGLRVYAYLQPTQPGFARMVQQLEAAPLRTLIVAPGAQRRAMHTNGNVRILSAMVSLAHALPQCDVVLSYAGHGMVAAALLAGKPLVLMPSNLEQLLTARCAVSLGAGVITSADAEGGIGGALQSVLTNPGFAQAAARFARKYAAYDAQVRAAEIATDLCALLQANRLAKPDSEPATARTSRPVSRP